MSTDTDAPAGPAAVARAYQDAQNAQDRQLPTWSQLSPQAKALRVREAGHWIAAVHAAEPTDLLREAGESLRSFALRALAVKTSLDKSYPDAPQLSPWTRFIAPEARRAHELARRIRKHLARS